MRTLTTFTSDLNLIKLHKIKYYDIFIYISDNAYKTWFNLQSK